MASIEVSDNFHKYFDGETGDRGPVFNLVNIKSGCYHSSEGHSHEVARGRPSDVVGAPSRFGGRSSPARGTEVHRKLYEKVGFLLEGSLKSSIGKQ